MIDLTPATQRTAALITAITDQQLTLPTPCPAYRLADLLDHVDGLAVAFTDAATKTQSDETPAEVTGDGSRLGDDWRSRIPARLSDLASAWSDASAWEGATLAGGVEMPSEIAGLVALDEVIVHGWDIARATGQPYEADPTHVEACIATMGPQPGEDRPAGSDVPFGRPVEVSTDMPPVDRLAAVLGRDPAWRP